MLILCMGLFIKEYLKQDFSSKTETCPPNQRTDGNRKEGESCETIGGGSGSQEEREAV